MEQIWMPGVHADIGGGYSKSFLSTISLLWMIDRLAHHCPEIGFDADHIEDNFVSIIRDQSPVINDEWRKYLFFLGRYLKPFVKAHRSASRDPNHSHRHHPMTDLIQQMEIEIRSRRKPYVPTIYLSKEMERLSVAEFSDRSWYASRLQQILTERFQNISPPKESRSVTAQCR
jgi:T6SS, Phospholipase effector Tle1-like, catalytic domain